MRTAPGVRGLVAAWTAAYLLGIAFLLALPPWEGYDEMAHYSYAQQLAATGQPPAFEQGRLSRAVEDYLARAPGPYATTPPFDANGGRTYRDGFADPTPPTLAHAPPAQARTFQPGVRENWQAQHPPLYYWLLVPALERGAHGSWAQQLFLLRLLSWSLAFAGAVLALWATGVAVRRAYPDLQPGWRWIALLWPLVFPGFFPEFARLGNDALVVLVFAAVWGLACHCPPQPGWRWYAALGVALGVGGLVKATFLPIALAVFVWLAVRAWRAACRGRACAGLALCMVLCAACIGDWYVGNLLERGSLSGLAELSGRQAAHPSWLSAFARPLEVARGLAGMALTFVWGGTASSAYPPVALVLPLLVPPAALLLGAGGLLRRSGDAGVLAALLLASVAGALIYYLLVRIAVTGFGSGAPGWYLQVLIGPLSLLLAAGWQFWRQAAPRLFVWVVRSWMVYALGFVLALAGLQVALFAGCAVKTATDRGYVFAETACLFDLAGLAERLGGLAYPVPAALALGLAVALPGLLLWGGRR